MASAKLIEVLGGWKGYSLGTIGRMQTDSDREDVLIELHPTRNHPQRCSGCGQTTRAIHDSAERWVRDLPLLDADTWLLVHRVRAACPACGPKLEDLSWLAPVATTEAPLRGRQRSLPALPSLQRRQTPNTYARSVTISKRLYNQVGGRQRRSAAS